MKKDWNRRESFWDFQYTYVSFRIVNNDDTKLPEFKFKFSNK